MNKLLVICGPTATGKTELGIYLAKKYNGEIISADSRQVYRGIDVITGKDLPVNSELRTKNLELNIKNQRFTVGYREKEEIPVWLVDIVDPDYPFNVGEYSILAQKVINDIWSREKLPIIVGGTGLYIKSIITPMNTLIIPPNNTLRKDLEKKEKEFMQQKLIEEYPNKWEKMNQSDRNNPRRLIRALEVAQWRKNNSDKFSSLSLLRFDSLLMVGLTAPLAKFLYQRIDERVDQRIKEGAVEELKKLVSKRYSWFLPALTASGCRELKEFVEGRETLKTASVRWKFHEHNYAGRQVAWFRKDKRIMWFDITEKEYIAKIEKVVEKWYTS